MSGSIASITFDTGDVRTLFFVAFKAIRIPIKDWAIALVRPSVSCHNAMRATKCVARWSTAAKGGEYIVEEKALQKTPSVLISALQSRIFVPSCWLFPHFF